MKQASIKVKNYKDAIDTIDSRIGLRSKVLYFIVVAFGIFSFLYVLVLGNMIFNIIERKTVELDIRNLANEVGNLESDYIALANTIDKNSSVSFGFNEISPVFATRTAIGFIPEGNNTRLAANEI
ncbi:MAG: hypothetical protein WC011_00190 [Candidatus Paceibacterota bacterium]